MNCSKLIKAMALIGLLGFGSHVFASFTPVGEDDFEDYNVGSFTNQLDGTDWTSLEGDVSEIESLAITNITAALPVSYDGYAEAIGENTQVLKLNTEGNDLKFAVNTESDATVLVDTLIRMVGSDTEQAIAENDSVQTAVYLDTSDEENPVLKAYMTVEEEGEGIEETLEENAWVALSNENLNVQDGDWVWLQVSIDYTTGFLNNQPLVTFTVNGFTLTNAVGESAFVSANRIESFSKGQVTEVAFRGTGNVDNFSVSEESAGLGSVTIITKYVGLDGAVLDEDFTDEVVYYFGQSYNQLLPEDLDDDGFPGFEFKRARLKDGDDTILDVFEDAAVVFEIASPDFVDGQTYYVYVVYGPVGQDEPEPEPEADIEFDTSIDANANLKFTKMELDGDTLTVTFTADGEVTKEQVTLWLVYKETLVGTKQYVEIEADVSSDEGALGGTFEIDLSEVGIPDGAFFIGLSTEGPQAI